MQEYKEILGFPGYEISREGILRSKDRLVTHKNGRQFNLKSKQITYKLPKGASYYQVHLYQNGSSKLFRIHQLVALTWLPNPNNYPIVNHKDGNKLNNHADNLEWMTQSQNIRHCKKVLGKNLNISFSEIMEVYSLNQNVSLEEFISIIKLRCK